MNDPHLLPQWSKRVSRDLIWQIYENDARGMPDETLLDEVGWALFHRCKSFIAAVEAVHGRIECPACRTLIRHSVRADEVLLCPSCGWNLPWQDYFHTFQNKQLSGDWQVIELFQEFIDAFPKASSAREKMLNIDRLIHGFHWNAVTGPRRTTGVNLIDGNYHDVVEFLNRLTYGEGSTPGLKATYAEWRGKIRYAAGQWQDTRLGRLFEEGKES